MDTATVVLKVVGWALILFELFGKEAYLIKLHGWLLSTSERLLTQSGQYVAQSIWVVIVTICIKYFFPSFNLSSMPITYWGLLAIFGVLVLYAFLRVAAEHPGGAAAGLGVGLTLGADIWDVVRSY